MKKSWKILRISCLLILLLFLGGCSTQASGQSQDPEEETASSDKGTFFC